MLRLPHGRPPLRASRAQLLEGRLLGSSRRRWARCARLPGPRPVTCWRSGRCCCASRREPAPQRSCCREHGEGRCQPGALVACVALACVVWLDSVLGSHAAPAQQTVNPAVASSRLCNGGVCRQIPGTPLRGPPQHPTPPPPPRTPPRPIQQMGKRAFSRCTWQFAVLYGGQAAAALASSAFLIWQASCPAALSRCATAPLLCAFGSLGGFSRPCTRGPVPAAGCTYASTKAWSWAALACAPSAERHSISPCSSIPHPTARPADCTRPAGLRLLRRRRTGGRCRPGARGAPPGVSAPAWHRRHRLHHMGARAAGLLCRGGPGGGHHGGHAR